MTIALLTDGIWPFVIGGMQRHSFYLCKYLVQKEVFIDLYHSTRDGLAPDLTICFTDNELKYIREHYIPYPSSDKWPGHYLRRSFKYSALVFDVLSQSNMPDLIYAKGLSGWALLKHKQTGSLFPPVCINVHGYEYYQAPGSLKEFLKQLMLRPAFRYINRHADYIFSYGARISDIIRKYVPESHDRIVEIPAGIEKEFLFKENIDINRVRQFVFLGRFERRKGVQELLIAIRRLSARYDFHFHLVGNIPKVYRQNNSKVTFHGELIKNEEIRKILVISDVLVCPSYAEGMPNVILEGMACGCAIIGTNVGAIPVQISAANGWLIRPGSITDLYVAMEEAITIDDFKLSQMQNLSLEKVKSDFLWEDIIIKHMHIFKRIIKDTKADVRKTVK